MSTSSRTREEESEEKEEKPDLKVREEEVGEPAEVREEEMSQSALINPLKPPPHDDVNLSLLQLNDLDLK